MKHNITIVCLLAIVLCVMAGDNEPFDSPSHQTAEGLSMCVNNHKALRDVQIIYGYGAGHSPEVAAKVERGEAILGGCMPHRKLWVFCSTCGLRYDDDFDRWRDDRRCSIEELRVLWSDVLHGFPISESDRAERIEYLRWYGSGGLEGELISFWTTARDEDTLAELRAWVPDTVEILVPEPETGDRTLKSWKWTEDGRQFKLNYLKVFSPELESHLRVEWHQIAEQAAPSNR